MIPVRLCKKSSERSLPFLVKNETKQHHHSDHLNLFGVLSSGMYWCQNLNFIMKSLFLVLPKGHLSKILEN